MKPSEINEALIQLSRAGIEIQVHHRGSVHNTSSNEFWYATVRPRDQYKHFMSVHSNMLHGIEGESPLEALERVIEVIKGIGKLEVQWDNQKVTTHVETGNLEVPKSL